MHATPPPNGRALRSYLVAAALAVALVAALVRLPVVVADAFDALEQGRRGPVERELAPADALDVPEEMLVNAARVIPKDANYNVVVGDQLEPTEPQRIGIPELFRYWLLPRHRIEGLDRAEWVVTYGHSSETLGIPIRREIPLAEGVNAIETGR